MLNISIIGRPNVGKTSIFNRIVGCEQGIVADIAGVTRDRNAKIVKIGDYDCNIIDTAGLNKKNNSSLEIDVYQQTLLAIDEGDVIFFVIDYTDQLIDDDRDIINLLRKNNKQFILLVNKIDKAVNKNIDFNSFPDCSDIDTIKISASHNSGFHSIIKSIKVIAKAQNSNIGKSNINDQIKLAVIGRPNAGKSTFINNILQVKRLITNEIAGTTRDVIANTVQYKNHTLEIVDTAGIRKKANITDNIEQMAITKSLDIIAQSNVVLLMMDVENCLESQDLLLANKALEYGKIVILCFNKWDKVTNIQEKELLSLIEKKIRTAIPTVKSLPFFTISALNESNMNLVLDEVITLYNKWSKKFKTKFLNEMIRSHDIIAKFNYNIKYISHIKTRPQIFSVHIKTSKKIAPSEISTLKYIISDKLDLKDIPIIIKLKITNPHINKS